MKNIIKSSIVAALLAVSAQASAQTVTFNFNYLANNGGVTNGSSIGYFPTSVGTITFTDLADLNLGDGQTGVRTTVALNNLNQFRAGNTVGGTTGTAGSIFIASFEINFAGTQNLTETVGTSWRQVSGVNVSGKIEMDEKGSLTSGGVNNYWGDKSDTFPGFGQEINFVAGAFTQGLSSTIDWLNGEKGYNGFSVAQLLANPVENQNASLPDVYAWIKIRSTGQAINTANSGQFWLSPTNSSAGGRLDVLAVPEAETYAMMMAGLALIGTIVRRRKTA